MSTTTTHLEKVDQFVQQFQQKDKPSFLLRQKIHDHIEKAHTRAIERPIIIQRRLIELDKLKEVQSKSIYKFRHVAAIDRFKNQLVEELYDLDSGTYVDRMIDQVTPFLNLLDWYTVRSETNILQTESRNPIIPQDFSNVARDLITNLKGKAPLWNIQDLLEDYLTTIEGAGAPIHILTAEQCKQCNIPLVLSQDGSQTICSVGT